MATPQEPSRNESPQVTYIYLYLHVLIYQYYPEFIASSNAKRLICYKFDEAEVQSDSKVFSNVWNNMIKETHVQPLFHRWKRICTLCLFFSTFPSSCVVTSFISSRPKKYLRWTSTRRRKLRKLASGSSLTMLSSLCLLISMTLFLVLRRGF